MISMEELSQRLEEVRMEGERARRDNRQQLDMLRERLYTVEERSLESRRLLHRLMMRIDGFQVNFGNLMLRVESLEGWAEMVGGLLFYFPSLFLSFACPLPNPITD